MLGRYSDPGFVGKQLGSLGKSGGGVAMGLRQMVGRHQRGP